MSPPVSLPCWLGSLKGWPSNRLALALDATSLGDRFTVLSISVVYRGSASPVAWKIVQANVRHAWKPEWITLLRLFHALVPAGWTVIVMTDRGLYARWLFQEIVALGWHPLMRITVMSKFRQNGSRSSLPVTAFVPKAGQRWQGRGVAFPRKPCRRLDCTLLACWEPGHERTMVRSDRLGAGPERKLVVRDAGLDRKRVQAAQKRRLAMAEDPDDRPRPREPIVAGTGRRHSLRTGCRWGSRRVRDSRSRRRRRWPPPREPPAPSSEPATPSRSARARRPIAQPIPSSRVPGKRASGTKKRLVSVFRQGLAVLVSHSDRGTCVAQTSMETGTMVGDSSQFQNLSDQPPTPVPKTPSL